MNCPGHILIYKNSPRSYRDLPVRLAELGKFTLRSLRNDAWTAARARFTQDDAHIFSLPARLRTRSCLHRLAEAVLTTFGFKEFKVELSTWDPNDRAHYAGSDDNWELATNGLKSALERKALPIRPSPARLLSTSQESM